jgi:plastocyanin
MKSKFITAGFPLALWGTLILASCSKDSGYGSGSNNGNNQTSNTVSIENMSYNPGTVTVKAGSTVSWINNDMVDHTVTANDGSFDSGDMKAGSTFTHTFPTTGTFAYHCTFHANMKASVVVN